MENYEMDKRISFRLNKTTISMMVEIGNANPNKYDSNSHILRVAIIMLYKHEMNKKGDVNVRFKSKNYKDITIPSNELE